MGKCRSNAAIVFGAFSSQSSAPAFVPPRSIMILYIRSRLDDRQRISHSAQPPTKWLPIAMPYRCTPATGTLPPRHVSSYKEDAYVLFGAYVLDGSRSSCSGKRLVSAVAGTSEKRPMLRFRR